jgi:hypothetical protein
MSRIRRSWKATILATAAAGSVTALLLPVSAHATAGAAPRAAAHATEPTYEVIAQQLKNPRGISVQKDGTVLVAESGEGKIGCGAGETCVGATGAIYQVKGSTQGRVLTGLPSLSAGANASGSAAGPTDVEKTSGGYTVLNGVGDSVDQRATFGEDGKLLGTLNRNGRVIGDLVKHESTQDPDASMGHTPSVLSNAWRFLSSTRGGYLVTDAAGNDVLSVFNWFGWVKTRAVLPDTVLADGTKVQAVPGGIVEAPDGTVYISDIGALRPGLARIWKMSPGQQPQVLISGLTAVIDLAMDSQGDLIALTHSQGYQQGAPPLPGKLNKIDVATRTVTEIPTANRLAVATGVAVGPHDEIYVSNQGVGLNGQLVKITQ